jgi:hypothetical protein
MLEMLAQLAVDQQDSGRECGVDGPGGRGRGWANRRIMRLSTVQRLVATDRRRICHFTVPLCLRCPS